MTKDPWCEHCGISIAGVIRRKDSPWPECERCYHARAGRPLAIFIHTDYYWENCASGKWRDVKSRSA